MSTVGRLSTLQSRRFHCILLDLLLSTVVVVRVGNGSVVEIKEGESATLCAEIVSPAEVDREIIILGALTDGTATGEYSIPQTDTIM